MAMLVATAAGGPRRTIDIGSSSCILGTHVLGDRAARRQGTPRRARRGEADRLRRAVQHEQVTGTVTLVGGAVARPGPVPAAQAVSYARSQLRPGQVTDCYLLDG